MEEIRYNEGLARDRMNPCRVKFVEHNHRSVPILLSKQIEHMPDYEDSAKACAPNQFNITAYEPRTFYYETFHSKQQALLIARNGRLPSSDTGRKEIEKSGPTVVLEDVALYLHEDKVHVATEHGLVLVADYLKLLGLPDETRVRFHGRKASWLRRALDKIQRRQVLVPFSPNADQEAQGCIGLRPEDFVVVYDRQTFIVNHDGLEVNMAYGEREKDGIQGWFPWILTSCVDGRQDPDEYIDWTKFDYGPVAARYKAWQIWVTCTHNMLLTLVQSNPLPPSSQGLISGRLAPENASTHRGLSGNETALPDPAHPRSYPMTHAATPQQTRNGTGHTNASQREGTQQGYVSHEKFAVALQEGLSNLVAEYRQVLLANNPQDTEDQAGSSYEGTS